MATDHDTPAYQRAKLEWQRANTRRSWFVGSGVKHGMRRTATYQVHGNLKKRGAVLCDRWKDFANFYADMGERPEGYSLRRIVGHTMYGPTTCVWRPKDERQTDVGRHFFDPSEPHAPDNSFHEWQVRSNYAQTAEQV